MIFNEVNSKTLHYPTPDSSFNINTGPQKECLFEAGYVLGTISGMINVHMSDFTT